MQCLISPVMQRIVSLVVLCLGTGICIVMLMLWWVAVLNNAVVCATFNRYHEMWIEGVVFHVASIGMLWLFFTGIRASTSGHS